MPSLELQPSIAADPRARAYLRLSERLNGVPEGIVNTGPILTSWVDYVGEDVLPFLVWQWDIASPLWALVTLGIEGRREFVKTATALHRTRGTAAAVKTALASLGWTGQILEGQNSWGGTKYPEEQGWAVCRLVVDLTLTDIGTGDGILPWSESVQYVAGDTVRHPGATGAYYTAATVPPLGVPPRYDLVDEVPDVDIIREWGTLSTVFWTPPDTINGVPYRALTSRALALLEAAFYFFAPERCWLEIWALAPAVSDALPPMRDSVALAPTYALPPWHDVVALPGVAETFIRRTPVADGSYFAGGGIDAGATRPLGVADCEPGEW